MKKRWSLLGLRPALGALVVLGLAGLATPLRAQEEVPFITTPDHVTLAMLTMARVRANDFVIDLGSGDGRIVITAARRFGARGLGVEIVPELVIKSRANAQLAGVADRASFEERDLFATDLSRASVITMYLLPEVNLQLRPRLLALKPGTRIVSHDWDMGAWQPDQTVTVAVPDKAVGRDKSSRVLAWVVPAPMAGLWCHAGGWALEIAQRFQQVSVTMSRPARRSMVLPPIVFDARLDANDGVRVVAEGSQTLPVSLRWQPDGVHVTAVEAAVDSVAPQGAFTRARGTRCQSH